jgi:hypothetical protein
MKNNQKNQQDIDPGVLKKISLLEKTPERDPELAARSRGKFLSEVENLPLTGSASALGWLLGLFTSSSKDNTQLSIGKRKFAFSTIAAILFVVVVLFGGASATAYASQSALPGDALYPLKTSLEQTQITLANDAYYQAQLHLEFAQRRLNEIKELLSQGRTNDIEFASSEFEYYIQEAMKASQIIQAADPARGFELNKLVSQALLDYASALKSVLVSAPEAVKPVVEKALLASQDGAGEEVEIFGVVASITDIDIEVEGVIYSITGLTEFEDFIQPGDMVKLHVIVTRDGVMVVREIELSGATEDHSNQSGDDNSSESFDGNENENESDDGMNDNNSDDNSNDNESEDDLNGNESNENGDDNGTESDDDSNENDSDEDHNEDNDNSGSGSSNENNEDNSNEDDDENDNESEEDSDNSNESDENSNEYEEEDNKNGDD